MRPKGINGKVQTLDDRIGLTGAEQTPAIVLQNFTDVKGSPLLLFGEVKLI